jgi:hypothetical protein
MVGLCRRGFSAVAAHISQQMGARAADADVIVAVGERGGIPLHLSWIRGEERYARA